MENEERPSAGQLYTRSWSAKQQDKKALLMCRHSCKSVLAHNESKANSPIGKTEEPSSTCQLYSSTWRAKPQSNVIKLCPPLPITICPNQTHIAILHHVVSDGSQEKQCILATWNPRLIINLLMLLANMAYQEHKNNSEIIHSPADNIC